MRSQRWACCAAGLASSAILPMKSSHAQALGSLPAFTLSYRIMPFTFSHVAAVLPLRRAKLIWSALIVGSMAPDFPYVLGTTEYRSLGHRWPGAFAFTLPASLAGLWLFHHIIKRPGAQLLPRGWQVRLQAYLGNFSFGGAARFVMILLSLAIGIATHLLWDAFTHPLRWHGRRLNWLDSRVKLPIVAPMPRFMLLQYASSLLGLAILGVAMAIWYRESVPRGQCTPLRSRWDLALIMGAAAVVAAIIRARLIIGVPGNIERWDQFMLVAGVTAMAILFWEVFIYCLMISTHQVWIVT
jgi:hypothetical protein